MFKVAVTSGYSLATLLVALFVTAYQFTLKHSKRLLKRLR
jgi:hypothetical protein